VSIALDAGSRDNITAVVCDVVDAAAEGGAADGDGGQTSFYGAAAVRYMEGLESA
jgi:protein phosphatase